jgi:hypothetical protein
MAWDPGSRSNLNRLRRQGIVAVRYQAKGCSVQLEVLSHCIGSANKYEFTPYSANERKIAHNANELFAQLPLGAARFAGNVKGSRMLRTDYMMAGQYALPAGSRFKASDLVGSDCARATHVVSAVYVGAFAMGVGESRILGASATLLGARTGGGGIADVEVLSNEGDAEACQVSQKEAKENERCAVPLRVGLLAIDRAVPETPPIFTASPLESVSTATTASTATPLANLSRPPYTSFVSSGARAARVTTSTVGRCMYNTRMHGSTCASPRAYDYYCPHPGGDLTAQGCTSMAGNPHYWCCP